jgi:hypothetical protein
VKVVVIEVARLLLELLLLPPPPHAAIATAHMAPTAHEAGTLFVMMRRITAALHE